MRLTTLLLASSLGASVYATTFMDAVLSGRQVNDEGAYLQEVCFPNVTNPVPPCQEIINIQSQCPSGNTTNTLRLEAHAECICGGSFFEDWVGCLDCNYGSYPSHAHANLRFSKDILLIGCQMDSSRRALRTRSQRVQHHHNIGLEPPLHRYTHCGIRGDLFQLE